MKLEITPEEINEGIGDFAKAIALGGAIALSPMAHADEIPLDNFKNSDLIDAYNFGTAKSINNTVAQAMADEVYTELKSEFEVADCDIKETEAWGKAKATYDTLRKENYKVATAFLGRFNSNLRSNSLGVQLAALPPVTTEAMELPISTNYLEEKV